LADFLKYKEDILIMEMFSGVLFTEKMNYSYVSIKRHQKSTKQEQQELHSHSSTYALGSILTMQVTKPQTFGLILEG